MGPLIPGYATGLGGGRRLCVKEEGSKKSLGLASKSLVKLLYQLLNYFVINYHYIINKFKKRLQAQLSHKCLGPKGNYFIIYNFYNFLYKLLV